MICLKSTIVVLFILLLGQDINFGQELKDSKKEDVSGGMELIKIGAARILVPKGTRYRRKGNLIIFEDLAGYTGRRFLEIESRLRKIEEKIEKLQEEIKNLKNNSSPQGNKDTNFQE